jgi:hypothetical protein
MPGDGAASARPGQIRTTYVNTVMAEFARIAPPVSPPAGMTFKETPPPIGHQIVAFVEAPEDAKGAHLDIQYAFQPADDNMYRIVVTVAIRTKVEDPAAVATSTFDLGTFTAGAIESSGAETITNKVFTSTVGRPGG